MLYAPLVIVIHIILLLAPVRRMRLIIWGVAISLIGGVSLINSPNNVDELILFGYGMFIFILGLGFNRVFPQLVKMFLPIFFRRYQSRINASLDLGSATINDSVTLGCTREHLTTVHNFKLITEDDNLAYYVNYERGIGALVVNRRVTDLQIYINSKKIEHLPVVDLTIVDKQEKLTQVSFDTSRTALIQAMNLEIFSNDADSVEITDLAISGKHLIEITSAPNGLVQAINLSEAIDESQVQC